MKTLSHPADFGTMCRRISALNPDTRGLWGKMSAHQMICHLSDSFLSGLGRRNVSPATGPLQRTVMKWGALYFPMRWPKGVPTRPEVEQGVGGTRPDNFDRDRAKLLALMKEFTAPGRDWSGRAHPFFGPLSPAQWQRWGYLHCDHHLRQFGL